MKNLWVILGGVAVAATTVTVLIWQRRKKAAQIAEAARLRWGRHGLAGAYCGGCR